MIARVCLIPDWSSRGTEYSIPLQSSCCFALHSTFTSSKYFYPLTPTMSYHRSTRSHQDSILPRNSVQYSCTSQPPMLGARSYVATPSMTAPMPSYPSIRTHPPQNHPPLYSAPFFADPKPQAECAKQSYYDYGNVNDMSYSLQNQSCTRLAFVFISILSS